MVLGVLPSRRSGTQDASQNHREPEQQTCPGRWVNGVIFGPHRSHFGSIPLTMHSVRCDSRRPAGVQHFAACSCARPPWGEAGMGCGCPPLGGRRTSWLVGAKASLARYACVCVCIWPAGPRHGGDAPAWVAGIGFGAPARFNDCMCCRAKGKTRPPTWDIRGVAAENKD